MQFPPSDPAPSPQTRLRCQQREAAEVGGRGGQPHHRGVQEDEAGAGGVSHTIYLFFYFYDSIYLFLIFMTVFFFFL